MDTKTFTTWKDAHAHYSKVGMDPNRGAGVTLSSTSEPQKFYASFWTCGPGSTLPLTDYKVTKTELVTVEEI
jgi:hypothetical protein